MSTSIIQRCKQFYWDLIPRLEQWSLHARLLGLNWRNRLSSASVISADGQAVVSLTTYGARLANVHLTLESIGAGIAKPRRIILWLDKEVPLPPALQRLMKRGVEVKQCENFGPHTKYFPYVESEARFELPLVTADDDVIYPTYWLARLISTHMQFPAMINCYRARDIKLTDTAFAPYLTWPLSSNCEPSLDKLLTGVSGVIYPVAMQQHLKTHGRAFIPVTPKNDDVWIHVVALRHRIHVRQLAPVAAEYGVSPGSQEQALWTTNQFGGRNDEQIRATYTAEDFNQLKAVQQARETFVQDTARMQ
ncbi:MAG: hypothetical protein ACJ8HI_01020 [Massilia sp.]